MKNTFLKKFVSFLLVVLLVVPTFLVSGCGKDKGSTKTMSMSMNPEITFVVDNENKIASISYGNSDADVLYANVNLVGMDVESAVKVFVELGAISGHVNFAGQDFTIDVSGTVDADVKALQETVSNKVKDVFQSLGVQVTVKTEEITAEYKHTTLVNLAKGLYPEYSEEELKTKTDEELVELVNAKQKQLEGLLTSQIQTIEETLNAVFMAAIDTARETIKTVEAKIEGLEGLIRNDPTLQSSLDLVKAQLATAKTKLNEAITAYQNKKAELITIAKAQMETVKVQMKTELTNQINLNKANALNKLGEFKTEGKITQEQYDYWVALINQYTNAN